MNMNKENPYKHEGGLSLIELLVAIAISIIILVLITQVVGSGYKAYYTGYINYQSQTESIAVVQKIGKEVRQSTELIDAQPQSITIHEYVVSTDAAPAQVRFFLDGTDLKRGEILPEGVEPPYTYDPLNESIKTMSTKVTNGEGDIFAYYDQDGALLDQPVSEAEVTLVKVDLQFSRSNYADPFPVSTKIQLRYNKTNL